MSDQQYIFKVLVVGPSSAGKTSCVHKLVENKFDENYKPTIGVDFSSMKVAISLQNQQIQTQLQLWDIAGQEQCNIISRSYYSNSQGCIIVIDSCDPNADLQAKSWLAIIRENVTVPGTFWLLPVVLLINKMDLPDQANITKKQEKMDEIQKIMSTNKVFCTSARTGDGLQEAIQQLTKEMAELQQKIEKPVQQGLKIKEKVQKRGCC